jgi:CRP-like cAMP-binding protein
LSWITSETFAERFPELASSLEPAALEALLGCFEMHDAAAGEALVAQGTESSELFLVWDGELDITMKVGSGERKLAAVGPAQLFGEVSLLDPGPAGASVTTEQGCVVLRLSREGFDKLRGSNPDAAAALLYEVLRSLSHRAASASAQLGRAAVGQLVDATSRALHEGPPEQRIELGLSVGEQVARAFRQVADATREQVAVGAESVTGEYDVVVIGAGPHALAYATWIKQDRPQTRIALVEKRPTPGFKIGESTLGPVIRAWMSLGIPLPAMRRLFNNKLGLHFWWTGADTDEIHAHVDQVVEETYQVERRVLELLMMNVARRAGVEVHQGTRVLIDQSRIEGQPKELVCETEGGDVMRLRASIVCDASGPAAVLGRHLGIRRKNTAGLPERPPNARTWPDSPATATAPRTPASTGGSSSTCSPPPTGCRSRGAWPTRRPANETSAWTC